MSSEPRLFPSAPHLFGAPGVGILYQVGGDPGGPRQAALFTVRQAALALRIGKPRPIRHRCLPVSDRTGHPYTTDGRLLDSMLGAKVGASEPSPIVTPFENDRGNFSADIVISSAIDDRLRYRGDPSSSSLGLSSYAGCFG